MNTYMCIRYSTKLSLPHDAFYVPVKLDLDAPNPQEHVCLKMGERAVQEPSYKSPPVGKSASAPPMHHIHNIRASQ